MARRRKGLPVHGWLIFDKPQGMTSTQAVARVKRLYDAAKAGHAGTLDPLATGVLPIALGEATKTVPFVVEGSKEYRFTVRFGAETDTDDSQGKPTDTSETRPTGAEIEAKLPHFTGEIDQVPPRYSALKVDGGMVYNELLMQFQSDVLNVPVIRPKVAETTALGAAYAAGLAVGFWGEVEDLRANWAKDKEWTPSMDDAEREKEYRFWKKAVTRTFDWVEAEAREPVPA